MQYKFLNSGSSKVYHRNPLPLPTPTKWSVGWNDITDPMFWRVEPYDQWTGSWNGTQWSSTGGNVWIFADNPNKWPTFRPSKLRVTVAFNSSTHLFLYAGSVNSPPSGGLNRNTLYQVDPYQSEQEVILDYTDASNFAELNLSTWDGSDFVISKVEAYFESDPVYIPPNVCYIYDDSVDGSSVNSYYGMSGDHGVFLGGYDLPLYFYPPYTFSVDKRISSLTINGVQIDTSLVTPYPVDEPTTWKYTIQNADTDIRVVATFDAQQ